MTDAMTDAELVERLHGFSMYPEAAIDEHNQSSRMVKSLEISSELMTQAATRIQSLTADLERAKEGLEDALKCTPFVFEGQIGFDGGDPYDVIRRTLKDISHD